MSKCANVKVVFTLIGDCFMPLVIRKASCVVSSVDQILFDCDILINDGRIVELGNDLEVPEGIESIDAAGCTVIPGLINSHTHLYQNFLKGISPGLSLIPWCDQVLFPAVRAYTRQFQKGNSRPAFLWSAAAVIEMIKGGITCCLDMAHIKEESFSAWKDIGFRGVIGYTLANQWIPDDLIMDEQETRDTALEFIKKWHQPDRLTQVFLAPSTTYLCDDELLTWAGEQVEDHDLGFQIHISEISSENQDSLDQKGFTPIGHLHKLNLLSPRLSAVHCVHVTDSDINLMADNRVQVVHCPKSNMKLADGIAPITEMKRAGIHMSLGTDGCASNDLLDMWEEMRAAVFLSRVATDDANALSAKEVFTMATEGAAQVCRINAGRIQPGCLADLAIIDMSGAHLRPFHADRILEILVFCVRADDVRDTIINGDIVMKSRRIRTIDENQIMDEADAVRAEIMNDWNELM